MKVVTYSHARNALKSVLDTVVRDSDVAIIKSSGCRRRCGGDVSGPLQQPDGDPALLSTPANAAALARAIRQDQAGQAQPRNLAEADGD